MRSRAAACQVMTTGHLVAKTAVRRRSKAQVRSCNTGPRAACRMPLQLPGAKSCARSLAERRTESAPALRDVLLAEAP